MTGMTHIQNVSRRGFLKDALSGCAFVLGVCYLPSVAHAGTTAGTPADRATFHPNAFLGLETDGTVYIIAHRSEMGNGSRTTLPRVVADEMDADWSRVQIVQAIGDARYGSQETDGSQSIRKFFTVMREMGAMARLMLIRAAAIEWSVPVSQCESGLHVVEHIPTHRKLPYGELAISASKLPVPKKAELKLKPRTAWRYIGRGAGLYDLKDICTGKAVYGIDARIDGMVYASIEHPPVLGGKVKSYEDREALRVPGVRRTVLVEPFNLPYGVQPLGGVAVIADNTWAAFQGRKKVNVTWDLGPNASYNSDQFKKELQQTAHQPGKVVRNQGDVDTDFARGGKTFEAEYYVPHLAHATMEPPVAVADFRDDKVTVWAPTQDPQGVQQSIARELGIRQEAVTCHVTLLGGGFGRKSFGDFAVEAAVLSKKVGKPVKVVWSREDDIKFDYYLPVAAVYLKAALDSNGGPTSWLARSAFPPINSTFDSSARYGGWELEGSWIEVPFDIPNIRVEVGPARAHVRVGWLRSVASNYHTFAVQSFIDDLAHKAGRDPLEYLLELFGPPRILDLNIPGYPQEPGFALDIGRLRRVTEMAAEKAGWGRRKLGNGRGMGIAVHRYSLTYVASVVEVEVDEKGGVHIPRIDTAVDAGTAVNPANIKAQLEGAAVFGTSIARSCEITATNGIIDQSNFNDYPVARIDEAPYQTNVYVVESTAPPSGVGEPGVPVIAPALCNAIFAATGKRIRELPLSNIRLG
ncbi:MAG TPA: molybdopterin cofactor-binding domain-containing protein [Terriglobia bacterium]|nr:molybdopterin cofactor-binding domain-containing protein [Terriglobia bacterium]